MAATALSLLLDSVVVIDHFDGRPEATAFLSGKASESAVSVITRAEVLAGFGVARELALAEALLDRFPTLAIDRPMADLAALLRRRHGWKLPDAFQAALAQRHGLKLVTRNTRDFPPRRFDFVLVPYPD